MDKEIESLPPEEVIVKLKKLIKIIEHAQADLGSEITHAQARIIFPIWRDGKGYTIVELAKAGSVTKGLVSRTIADLEAKGYVERQKESANQDRNYKIVLTPKAHALARKHKAKMQKVSGKWNGKLTKDDFETFIRVLNIITDIEYGKEQPC
ncbi:MAG: MarR family winged helix-turn-helix transcriptional regulator [Firmicutes bacterium]|nr:MarR family winged helix-turn-helix transcriptional regulator [Bacillota bacterium]